MDRSFFVESKNDFCLEIECNLYFVNGESVSLSGFRIRRAGCNKNGKFPLGMVGKYLNSYPFVNKTHCICSGTCWFVETLLGC